MSEQRSSRFIEGVLVGATLGAVLGLLLAPQSGAETRRKLRRLKNSRDAILKSTKDKTEELINKTMYAIETGFNKIGKVVDRSGNGKSEYEEFHG